MFKIPRLAIALSLLAFLTPLLMFNLSISPAASFREVSSFNSSTLFDQVWQTINTQFYDPKFNGVDWQALRQQYQLQVKQTRTREEAATLINTMLAKLQTSHTRLYIPEEPAYYQLLGIFQPRLPELQKQLKPFFPDGKITYRGIGIFTRTLDGVPFVSGVLEGSPAAKAGVRVGDRIVSVAGRPFHPIRSFQNSGDRVEMVIQPTAREDSRQTLTVTPKLFDATTMFLESQLASTEVIQRQNRRIGYMHLWSYASDQYQEQLEDELLYGRLKDVDAFVLDLRGGWGGASPTVLNFFTGRGPSITSIVPRQKVRTITPSHWPKPVVMVVNGESRSAKEILAYAFQQYKIGPVVGAKTPGAVVAGRPFLMPDGSVLYVAVADVLVDQTQRLEGEGVAPDLQVDMNLPYAQGVDPQKERAIEIAGTLIKA
uniref:Peptidase S41 n=1 Tax=Cyanothece sp. (strain PCC 7425 / ATCC 29141) TaxID=395961 RepID=B8HQF9_CYAP4